MLKSKFILSIAILSICFVFQTQGQQANQWIDFNQAYYKVNISQEGVYELSYDDLINAQIQLSSIDARTLQLFHRGQEIAIIVNGQSDGRLDPGDNIQFIAQKNDGLSDTFLYDEPSAQPHTLYNLFEDETAYFLTWSLDGTIGKRMTRINPIANSGGLPAESSMIAKVQDVLVNSASRGKPFAPNNGVRKSSFNLGEGFSGSVFTGTSNFTLSGIEQQNRGVDNLTFELLIQGRNNRAHTVEVLIGPNATTLRSIAIVNFDGFEYVKLAENINWADVNINGDMLVRVNATANTSDNVSISYLNLSYNRTFDMTNAVNARYSLLPNLQNSSYVSFSNVNSSAKLYRIDDFKAPQLLETTRIGNVISTVVQNTNLGAKIYLQNQAFLSPQIEKVSFRDLSTINPSYVIISHKDLNGAAGNYAAVVSDYAAYRASISGGSYDTMVVFMDELFDQFNYGESSPAAVYRFSRYLAENTKTEFVFLMGKGINWYNRPYRKAPAAEQYNEYVPSAGDPGSDNLYGYGVLAENEFSLSFGRLNAHNAQNIADYLDKIIEMESSPLNDLRRKAFLHLSGGLSESEIATFNFYIKQFTQFAQSPFIGGTAEEITKQTTQVVELINVAEQVNQGLNMITFFGHSGTNSADIDIGFVSNPDYGYQNKGKYPLIYINGCNAGSIFELPFVAKTFGEDWVNSPDLGATHVLAHTSEGFPSELKRYSDVFYGLAYGDSAMIDEPIGKVHIKAGNNYLDIFGDAPAEIFIAQAQQFNLMGDPAYKLFPTNKPDFAITDNDVSIRSLDGTTIDALTNDFALDLIIRNFGITTSDSLAVTVNRRLPNNELIALDTQYFASPYFQDTISYIVSNGQIGEFGESSFEIILDANQTIDEMDEMNNIANINYFFSLGTTINLYPYNASIVNTNNVVLTTQSVDLLSSERNYLFEIDTVADFSSPFLKQGQSTGRVIAKWDVALLSNAYQSYYWRTRFADIAEGELDDWTNSYFVYEPGLGPGWAQSAFNEFNKNEYLGLTLSPNNWQFFQKEVPLSITCIAEDGPTPFQLAIAGDEYVATESGLTVCRKGSVNLVAFDQVTGAPYLVLSTPNVFDVFDPLSCGRRPQLINQIFNENLNDPTTYFQRYYNKLSVGDYVLMSSYDSTAWQVLIANNRAELLDLGASSSTLDALRNGNPYILLGRKGAGPGNGIERFSFSQPEDDPSTQLLVSLNEPININFTTGIMTSTTIGPAKNWQEVNASFVDVEVEDHIRVDVFGIDSLNMQTLLFSDVSLPHSIAGVNANTYPYLRLRTILTDSNNFTPARVSQWQVRYEELPDAVLIPNQSIPETTEQIAEGLTYSLDFKLVNVTPNAFDDSIRYQVKLFNQDSRQDIISKDKLVALAADSEVDFKVEIDSRNKVGVNDFNLNVNPDMRFNEYRKINNQISLFKLLSVKKDSIPPFLDVTFDGIGIMDGDIVAPAPVIKVTIKDENKLLLKNDTTDISMSVQGLCETCSNRPIYFSNPQVNYSPATESEPFTITYQADKFDDGLYKLKVQVADESANAAGEEPYEVSFEVVNASTITNFFPYPNPFSTQTRFVFTLTGSEVPDELKIQILTVSGRVVREILQDEIGFIHIGNNITEYAWNGTDEFGDRLANGVYLYRVLVRKNGVFMDQRETSADKAFKKGYGKMYLLR